MEFQTHCSTNDVAERVIRDDVMDTGRHSIKVVLKGRGRDGVGERVVVCSDRARALRLVLIAPCCGSCCSP